MSLSLSTLRYFVYSDREIGAGTFSKVYRGKDPTEDDAPVAIKRVDMISKFREAGVGELSEVEIMLQLLPHDSIIDLVDYHEGLLIVMVLEYMPDGDLFDRLQDEGVTQTDWRSWLVQAAEGLEYVHPIHP